MNFIWTSPAFVELCCSETCSLSSDHLGTSCMSVTGYPFCLSLFSNILQKLIHDPAIVLPRNYISVLMWVYKNFSDKTPCGDLALWSRLLSLKPTPMQDSSTNFTSPPQLNSLITTLTNLACETVSRIKALYPGDVTGVPIGIAIEANISPIFLIMLIHRPKWASSTFQVAIVNVSATGLEYHAYQVEEKLKTGSVLRDALFVLSDVIPERITHSSFWIATFRLMLRPSHLNFTIFYTALLPYLNDKALLNNWITFKNESTRHNDVGGFWFSPPQPTKAGSCITGVLACFHFFLCIAKEFSLQEIHAITSVLFRWGVLLCCQSDLRKLLDKEESHLPPSPGYNKLVNISKRSLFLGAFSLNLLSWAVRCFNLSIASELDALHTSNDYKTSIFNQDVLMTFKNVVNWLDCLIFYQNKLILSPSGLQFLGGGGAISEKLHCGSENSFLFSIESFCFPFFGRFRPDVQPSLSGLVGNICSPPLIIPVDLTSVTNVKLESLLDVCTVLRNTFEACVLLGNQRHLIRHSYSLRFQLIRHVILNIIPLPLPCFHPLRESRCFWASQRARRETKTELMRLLHAIARHFVTVSFSITNTRDIDAQRVIVMAALCTLMDGVLRCPMHEQDVAFPLGIHYSGAAPGPVSPFAFDLRFFADQSEFLLFFDPLANTVRTQILDYMNDLHKTVIHEDQLLFSFELSTDITPADRKFLEQICLQYGFSHDPASLISYYTGDDPEFSDFAPEWVYLRDTVFYFKALMTPEATQLPAVNCWRISDATLKWSYNSAKSHLVVRGFQMVLECAGFVKSDYYERRVNSGDGVLTKFLGWFGMATSRAPPSAADPTNLVEGHHRIETEDDVLYLKTLPTFCGKLSITDIEVLLQYLTVPYLRIPLVLQFFSDEQRIEALADSLDLRNVLVATLFEPSLWKPPSDIGVDPETDEATIQEIPPKNRSSLGTPLGILFNELVFAPTTVLAALERLLNASLEKDSGHVKRSALELIFFVTRLTVTVMHFVRFLIKHNEIWSSPDLSRKSWCGYASLARGLNFSSPCARQELEKMYHCLERRLHEDVIPLFEDRALKAVEISDLQTACAIHAHIVYIFKFELPTQTDHFSRFIGSLLFVFTHYHFSLECTVDKHKGTEKSGLAAPSFENTSLGISEMDLFLILEVHRLPLLQWFESHPEETGVVLERALSVAAFTRCILQARKWKQLTYFGGKGRFVPAAEAIAAENIQQQISSALLSAQIDVKSSHSPSWFGGGVKHAAADMIKSTLQKVFVSAWGRDGSQDKLTVVSQMSLYESWLRAVTRCVENTEFNFQIAEFSLMNHSLELLLPWVNEYPVFTSLFGPVGVEGKNFQSVTVSSTEYRYWCRLIGHRHDLQRWEPDERCQPFLLSNIPYCSSTMSASEGWVSDILDPWLQHHLPHAQFFICRDENETSHESKASRDIFETPLKPRLDHSPKNSIYLECLWPSPSIAKSVRESETTPRSVKELIVTEDPFTITVFNVVESGRSLFNVACYASDLHYSFCLPFSPTDVNNGNASYVNEECFPHRTLTIYRDIFSDLNMKQRYIPGEFLNGLIPGYLLTHYTFWQNIHAPEDDIGDATKSIIFGYPKDLESFDGKSSLSLQDNSETLSLSLLKLTVYPTSDAKQTNHSVYQKVGTAVALIQRFSIGNASLNATTNATKQDDAEALGSAFRNVYLARLSRFHQLSEQPDHPSVQEHFLFNLRDTPSDSELGQLGHSLLRLEDLSCILVWGAKSSREAKQFYLERIELPRLCLSFKSFSDPQEHDTTYSFIKEYETEVTTQSSFVEDGEGEVLRSTDFPLGQTKFQCEQHAKLFLTPRIFSPDSLTVRLTSEVSNSIILENEDGELFLLVDALAKPVIKNSSTDSLSRHRTVENPKVSRSSLSVSPYTTSHYETLRHSIVAVVSPFLTLNRHNASWIGNLGDSRYYLYSIHASRCFLFAPSPASALYLLLVRFLRKNYTEVCKALNATHLFDSEMDPEQQQIWTLLNSLDATYCSFPDAHATRIKLWLTASRYALPTAKKENSITTAVLNSRVETFTTSLNPQGLLRFSKESQSKKENFSEQVEPADASDVPFSLCSWNLEPDLTGYVMKLSYISGECRLSISEEYEVFRMFPSFVQKVNLLYNRQLYLQLLLNKRQHSLEKNKNLQSNMLFPDKLRLPRLPKIETFALGHDRTAVDGSYNPIEWINGLVGALVPFKRVEDTLSGPAATGFFLKVLDRGMTLKLFTDFHFLYELLTEGPSCSTISVTPTESSYYWGALFCRFLSPWEYRTPSQLMSFLRIILSNPRLTSAWPRLKEEKRHKIAISLMLRSQESLHRFFKDLHAFLREQENMQRIVWPNIEKPLSSTSLVIRQSDSLYFPRLILAQRHVGMHYSRDTSCSCRSIEPFDFNIYQFSLTTSTTDESQEPPSLNIKSIQYFSCRPLEQYIDIDELIVHTPHHEISEPIDIHVETNLLQAISSYPLSRTSLGKQLLERFRNELSSYRYQFANETIAELRCLQEKCLSFILASPKDLYIVFNNLTKLGKQLKKAYIQDGRSIETFMTYLKKLANFPISEKCNKEELNDLSVQQWAFLFYKLGGFEPFISLDTLVELLISGAGLEELRGLNPFLSETSYKNVFSLTAVLLLTVNRRNHLCQALHETFSLQQSLLTCSKFFKTPNREIPKEHYISVKLKMLALASILNSTRHYTELNDRSSMSYDPRFLAFEFAYNILLRKEQISLARSFAQAAKEKRSLCHQAVMGAGKTTIVAPLLSILLCDQASLIVQVVPQSLLEFTKTIFHERFSAIIKKGVITFSLSRYQFVTPQLVSSFIQAKEKKSVCLTTPTDIKSLFLKVIYLFYSLNQSTQVKNSLSIEKPLIRSGEYRKLRNALNRIMKISTNAKAQSSMSCFFHEEFRALRRELDLSLRLLELFQSSILLLDEVDMILHPLKSELHWPIGQKQPLDFTEQIGVSDTDAELEAGLRWKIPWYLIEPIFFVQQSVASKRLSIPLGRSREAMRLLQEFVKEFHYGIRHHYLQKTPHLVLSDEVYYHQRLKPYFARWMYLILRGFRFQGLQSTETIRLLCFPLHWKRECNDPLVEELFTQAERKLSETQFQMLNLSRQWINVFLPHIFQKVNRVGYGLMTNEEIKRHLAINSVMPPSRQFLAVPFSGKDTPSLTSEFAHPDIVIGLTIMAFRYTGLRYHDFLNIMSYQLKKLSEELGAIHKRPSSVVFATWVTAAGGSIRGLQRKSIHFNQQTLSDSGQNRTYSLNVEPFFCKDDVFTISQSSEPIESQLLSPHSTSTLLRSNTSKGSVSSQTIFPAPPAFPRPPDVDLYGGLEISPENDVVLFQKVWPLAVLSVKDDQHKEQLHLLYRLLWNEPLVIKSLLFNVVFPLTLQHCSYQFSASGQELGSSILFPIRFGFSGTPNALLPVELNQTVYESGIYGKIIHLLTSPEVVSIELLDPHWNVNGFLDFVARREDIHALIDTGALITGLSNYKVAELLLQKGLNHLEGVVFLDQNDRQMVLLRDEWKVIKLSECGLSWDKRFTFYDQIHTTGQDIKQHSTAKAFLTLNKDMSFRDIAQGAWRMRGIGVGHTLVLCVPPEVVYLVKKNACLNLPVYQRNKHDSSELFWYKQELPLDLIREGVSESEKICLVKDNHPLTMPLLENVRQALVSIMSWLIGQEVLGEISQYRLLLKQNLHTIWRKNAFKKLCSVHSEIGSSPLEGILLQCLDVFKDTLSFEIPCQSVTDATTLRHVLDLIKSHEALLETHEDHETISTLVEAIEEYEKIAQPILTRENIASGIDTLDTEMTLEQEGQQEEEQEEEEEEEEENEEEQEEEEEKENFPENITLQHQNMTRSNQPVHRWKLEDLTISPEWIPSHETKCFSTNQLQWCHPVFTQLSHFFVYSSKLPQKICSLNFPQYIWSSPNSVNMKQCHKTSQRLKNVLVIMEWIPDFKTHNSLAMKQLSGSDLRNKFEKLEKIFKLFDRNARGALPLHICRYVLLHAGVYIENDATWVNLKNMIYQEVIQLRQKISCEPTLSLMYNGGNAHPTSVEIEKQMHWDNTTRKPFGNSSFIPKTAATPYGLPEERNQPNSQAVTERSVLSYPFNNSEFSTFQCSLSKNPSKDSKTLLDDDSKLMTLNETPSELLYKQHNTSHTTPNERKELNDLFLINYTELKMILIKLRLFQPPADVIPRHFVFLSLEEAEAVRAALHHSIRRGFNSVILHKHCGVALRNLAADFSVLDTFSRSWLSNGCDSSKLISWTTHQRELAHACFRFFNSEAQYSPNHVEQLIECFIENSCDERSTFFTEVLQCRRRCVSPKSASLEKIFSTPTSLALVQLKALSLRLCYELELRELSISDAFNAMDRDSSGHIGATELYAGLRWLNIQLSPSDFLNIWNHIGKSCGQDMCTEFDFIQCFTPLKYICDESLRQQLVLDIVSDWKNMESSRDLIQSPLATEQSNLLLMAPTYTNTNLYHSEQFRIGRIENYLTEDEIKMISGVKDTSTINSEYLKLHESKIFERFKFRFVPHTSLEKVWEGQLPGSNVGYANKEEQSAKEKCYTVWRPDQLESRCRTLTRRNRERVCLGYFMCEGLDCQKFLSLKLEREIPCTLVLEIEDPRASYLAANVDLLKVIDILLPRPLGFKAVLRDMRGMIKGSLSQSRFVVWKPIPPDEKLFTSLGYVVTESNKAPAVDTIRCVPLKWTQEAISIPLWKPSTSESEKRTPALALSCLTGQLVLESSQEKELKAKQFQLKCSPSVLCTGKIPKSSPSTPYNDLLSGDFNASPEDTTTSIEAYIPELILKYKSSSSKRWF